MKREIYLVVVYHLLRFGDGGIFYHGIGSKYSIDVHDLQYLMDV